MAYKVQKKFRISDKKLLHIEVKTLAKNRLFVELEKLAPAKKVPIIGWQVE